MNATALKVIVLCLTLDALVGFDLFVRPWLDSLIPDLHDAHDIWADPFEQQGDHHA